MASNQPPNQQTRKRILSPQEGDEEPRKQLRQDKLIPLYISEIKLDPPEQQPNHTALLSSLNTHITIKEVKKLGKNFVIKVPENETEDALNIENWNTDEPIKISPTTTYINRNAYCLNKIRNKNTSNIKQIIENLLNLKIIYAYNDPKTNLFIFVPKNANNLQLSEVCIDIEGKNYFIRKYDPIENYLKFCKSCY